MPRQTLIGLVLGAWIAGTLFMWAVATQNFRLVDRILAGPPGAWTRHAQPLDPGDARLLMRYQASEVNRLFFERWGWAQVALAALFAALVARRPRDRWLWIPALVMLAIALGLQLFVVPETVRLGRALDFLPRDPAPPEAALFWRLHGAYTALDGTRLLISLFAAGRLLTARRTGPEWYPTADSARIRQEVKLGVGGECSRRPS